MQNDCYFCGGTQSGGNLCNRHIQYANASGRYAGAASRLHREEIKHNYLVITGRGRREERITVFWSANLISIGAPVSRHVSGRPCSFVSTAPFVSASLSLRRRRPSPFRRLGDPASVSSGRRAAPRLRSGVAEGFPPRFLFLFLRGPGNRWSGTLKCYRSLLENGTYFKHILNSGGSSDRENSRYLLFEPCQKLIWHIPIRQDMHIY